MIWEYKIVRVGKIGEEGQQELIKKFLKLPVERIESELNNLGKEGWELIEIKEPTPKEYVAFFKRQI